MSDALLPAYNRSELAFSEGKGAWLTALDGTRYLDFAAGIAVSALGHSHPHLVSALREQAGKLWHVSNLYQIPEQAHLAERLVAHSFADRVFFGNSGAEAGELAVKMIRRYQHETGHPERYRVICFDGAFHGRTLATLAAGGNAKYLAGFEPMVSGFDHVSFGNLNEMRARITPETAGILVEPVQGEGGIRPGGADFLRGLRAAADEFGLVLGFDEVQCGMGRTGTLWAYEQAGIEPDLMMVAKGLGGGFPVGALLASERIASVMTPGTHGSTFGGNPLAMSVGNAVLDVVLAPGFLDAVKRHGALLQDRLAGVAEAHPTIIESVRGQGLMLGLVAKVPAADIVKALRAERLLTLTAAQNVVRIVPPLIIGPDEIEIAAAALDRACRALEARP